MPVLHRPVKGLPISLHGCNVGLGIGAIDTDIVDLFARVILELLRHGGREGREEGAKAGRLLA